MIPSNQPNISLIHILLSRYHLQDLLSHDEMEEGCLRLFDSHLLHPSLMVFCFVLHKGPRELFEGIVDDPLTQLFQDYLINVFLVDPFYDQGEKFLIQDILLGYLLYPQLLHCLLDDLLGHVLSYPIDVFVYYLLSHSLLCHVESIHVLVLSHQHLDCWLPFIDILGYTGCYHLFRHGLSQSLQNFVCDITSQSLIFGLVRELSAILVLRHQFQHYLRRLVKDAPRENRLIDFLADPVTLQQSRICDPSYQEPSHQCLHLPQAFQSQLVNESCRVHTYIYYSGIVPGKLVGRSLVLEIERLDMAFEESLPCFGQTAIVSVRVVRLHIQINNRQKGWIVWINNCSSSSD